MRQDFFSPASFFVRISNCDNGWLYITVSILRGMQLLRGCRQARWRTGLLRCGLCGDRMFSDTELAKYMYEKGYQFSSANSINIGRLVPQMVYYVYAYTRLVADGTIKAGDKINVDVPTGNFGNILAAYYAKEMGLQSRSSSVRQMTTRFCLISSRQEHMIETESSYSQHHHRWISSSQATLRD